MAKLCPSLVKLRAEFNDAYPKRDKSSDGWVGDSAHSSRSSDHNPDSRGIVHAIDVDKDLFPGSDVEFNALVEKVANDPRIKYTIWRRRIKNPSGPWRPYTGSNPHDKHAHFSATVAGEKDARSWGIAAVAKPQSPKEEEPLRVVHTTKADGTPDNHQYLTNEITVRYINTVRALSFYEAKYGKSELMAREEFNTLGKVGIDASDKTVWPQ